MTTFNTLSRTNQFWADQLGHPHSSRCGGVYHSAENGITESVSAANEIRQDGFIDGATGLLSSLTRPTSYRAARDSAAQNEQAKKNASAFDDQFNNIDHSNIWLVLGVSAGIFLALLVFRRQMGV